jgi:hypothetical protein
MLLVPCCLVAARAGNWCGLAALTLYVDQLMGISPLVASQYLTCEDSEGRG